MKPQQTGHAHPPLSSMVLSRDKVEVVGALRLPLGGVNGYVGVRSRQGYNKDKFQGTTPTKKRRTKLFDSCFEAAVALAELIQQPQEQDDPIKHLDFASPISLIRCATCALRLGGGPPGNRAPVSCGQGKRM